jgi:hypothetical protein
MLHHSEVGIRIRFADAAGRDKVIAALGDRWDTIQEIVDGDSTSIEFHGSDVKWYTGLFEDVSVLDMLVIVAREMSEEGEVPSSGFFARIGEETGDVETLLWDAGTEGVPLGADLGHLEMSIQFDY